MYYIVQENTFKEENYNNLILGLERLNLPSEVVNVFPFINDIEIKTNRTDIFPFGALKLAEISTQYQWKPGSLMNENHDYSVYKDYYKDNLLNYDSKIIKLSDGFFNKELFFARPTKDTKIFTGAVFDMIQWSNLKERILKNNVNDSNIKNVEIQISTVKKIQQEIRFWIVKGKIITASQYRLGGRYLLNDNIDQSAYDFCNQMINLFELNDAFVMDVCLTDNKYKIVECGCINCAGFYKANMQKLLVSLEEAFN